MKNFLFALAAGFISALAVTNGASAQSSINSEVLEPQNNANAIEAAVTPAKSSLINVAAISPRALKDFAKTYKNASGEKWEKNSTGFSAKFTSNGVTNRIFYSPNGHWTGSVKGYNEAQISPDIRDIVKRQYYDFAITYVQEVLTEESENKPTYVVHLEDKNSIKLVRINDGEMTTWQEFQKQP